MDHRTRNSTISETIYFRENWHQFCSFNVNLASGCKAMNEFIEINGTKLNRSELPEDVLQNLSLIEVSKQNINDLNLNLQFLNKARDAYIAEIKAEINSNVSDFTFGDN